MGQRDGAQLNPVTAPPPPPRISEKRLGNQLPSGNKKGSPTLQSHPSPCTGKPRGSGGETGSARNRARSSTGRRRRRTGRPLGAEAERLGEASKVIGSVFPREKLSAPLFCRTFPMTLIFEPFTFKQKRAKPGAGVHLGQPRPPPRSPPPDGQHQPVAETRARPAPSHQTPALPPPANPVPRPARRSPRHVTYATGRAVGEKGRRLAGGGLCIPVASAAKRGARRRVSQVECHLF